MKAPDAVTEALRLAHSGIRCLDAGDFADAAALLKCAGRLANRAAFQRERIARHKEGAL